MRYTTKELATLLKQSPENIRVWTLEFSRHLSPSAVPKEKGRHRSYTDEDISVLALAADFKDRGLLFEEIHEALDSGERLTPKTNPLAVATFQEQIAVIQMQLDDTKQLLTKSNERAVAAEGQVALLERQLEQYKAELRNAYIEIGTLKPRG